MELFHREFGAGKPIIILHGMFGFSDNWQTIAKALADHRLVITPDLRNHGRSPHSDTHTYPEMAEDLRLFMESHWIFNGDLMGHSMGGKVAMQLALSHPEMVNRLVVVDMGVGQSDDNHTRIFDALLGLDLATLTNRQDAEAYLSGYIPEPGIRQFLLKNITREQDGRFSWKMNLPVIYQHFDDILAPVSGTPFDKPTLFVRGARSNYIKDADWPEIKSLFPQAQLATIENAGHWVHADQPQALLDTVREFLG